VGRIAVITQDPGIGGGVLSLLSAFLRFAASHGHICDVYYPATMPHSSAVDDLRSVPGVGDLYATPIPGRLPSFLRAVLFGRRCRLMSPCDAAYVVGSLDLALPFLRWRQRFVAWIAGAAGPEVRATPRTRPHYYLLYNPVTAQLMRRVESSAGSRASAILALSSSAARDVEVELGVPPAKLTVLPAPVDVVEFRPGTPVKVPRRYVLTVARLDRRKDFPTLLRAFRLVVDGVGDIELRVVGAGRERANLEGVVRGLGLDRHVVFMGALPLAQLVPAYQGASLFALASRQEGLGIVFLEAMACGLPVVTTDCGGSRDPIVHGRTGFLAPVGDWCSLADFMLRVLRDDDLARSMGRAGRERAVEEYSFDVVCGALDNVHAAAFPSAVDGEPGLSLTRRA